MRQANVYQLFPLLTVKKVENWHYPLIGYTTSFHCQNKAKQARLYIHFCETEKLGLEFQQQLKCTECVECIFLLLQLSIDSEQKKRKVICKLVHNPNQTILKEIWFNNFNFHIH